MSAAAWVVWGRRSHTPQQRRVWGAEPPQGSILFGENRYLYMEIDIKIKKTHIKNIVVLLLNSLSLYIYI